ncbi:MAG: hypothetical protein KatS3mg057_1326 [Herpetosiphonaceae bacterium]|nr:MAG: hypothetical protein KatS3mg057_1326 [Herpetosiphonaceae bacterium]
MDRHRAVLVRYSFLFFIEYLALLMVLSWPQQARTPALLVLNSRIYEMTTALNPLRVLGTNPAENASLALRLGLLLVLLALFTTFLCLLRDTRRMAGQTTLAAILIGAVLFAVPLLLLPYLLSNDIYAYIMYGRIAALYDTNPILIPPSTFRTDPFLPYLGFWKSTPSVYGPLWTLISHALTLLVQLFGGQTWLYLLAYKGVALAAHLATAALIWDLLGRWRPEQQTWGTLLYAWNPLALHEAAGSAHNDAIMIALIVLGIWLADRGRWRRALVALLGAALIKWIAIVMLPLYGMLLIRRCSSLRARLLIGGQLVAIAGVVTVSAYGIYGQPLRSALAPFNAPSSTREINSLAQLAADYVPQGLDALGLGPGTIISNQPLAVRPKRALDERGIERDDRSNRLQQRSQLSAHLQQRSVIYKGRQQVLSLASRFGKIQFALLTALALWGIWRRPTLQRLVRGSFWIFLMTLLIGSPWFWPWYTLWPLALAALLDWQISGRASALFTATAATIYVTYPADSHGLIENLRALFVFPPVLLFIAYLLWRQGRGLLREQ